MHTKEQLHRNASEHNECKTKSNFTGETKTLNATVSEIVTRKPSPEIMASIEFSKSITIQNEVLDIMRHDFKQHENAIEAKRIRLLLTTRVK